jgi:hypothetical protein
MFYRFEAYRSFRFLVLDDTVMRPRLVLRNIPERDSGTVVVYIVLHRILCDNALRDFLSKLLLGSVKKKIKNL